MITNYYVLRALAAEWDALLVGAQFAESYSHLPSELTLTFESARNGLRALRISTRPGRTFIYSEPEPRRPKSNVTSQFERATGETVESIELNQGDRILCIFLENDQRFEIHPYGSRPNVLLVADESIAEAFKRSDALAGEEPPEPRPLRLPGNARELESRLTELQGAIDKRLKNIYPQLGIDLVREALALSEEDAWSGLQRLLEALESPEPVVYEQDGDLLFSPIELHYVDLIPIKRFPSVDEGVRWTVKNRSREERLRNAREPILNALEKSRDRWSRRIADIEAAMESDSRADVYEEWGHLLMASPSAAPLGSTQVTLPNILHDGSPVEIPLDEEKTIIQNAERCYERARKLREERAHLQERLTDARENLAEVSHLAESFDSASSLKEVERLKKSNAEILRRHVGGKTPAVTAVPFRRFDIGGGYEVWIGRNARENDLLTFEHASKHDLWMHARGVPGSHVVLRIPGRNQPVDKRTKEIAAAIAAWYSSARGSGLVPVQITQRKYVTKPRRAEPGVVRVQNEEVILVEPGLPDDE